jgi:hypothetical protein
MSANGEVLECMNDQSVEAETGGRAGGFAFGAWSLSSQQHVGDRHWTENPADG